MKFSCHQQILSRSLNTVSKAVTSRTTIPILKGILLEASDEGVLKVVASDLDISIEKKIPVEVFETGSIVVSAKLFNDIIRKLPSEEVEIEEDNGSVIIRCLASEFRIVGQPADEFPSIGQIKEEKIVKIEKDLFKDMIKKTSFSASIEESKGVIVGVLIELNQDTLSMVALDGFRMAVTKEAVSTNETRRIIIAARILNEVQKILSEEVDQKEVNLMLDEKKIVILLEDTRIVLRIMEGEFIKYKEIIPKENQCRMIVHRSELLDCMERASLFAKEGKNNLIKLSMFRDKVIITSRSDEGNVKEEVFIEKEGTDLEIGFNAKYLLDVLKVIDEDEIALEFNTSVSPCIIKSIEKDEYLYLVLPVRITSNS